MNQPKDFLKIKETLTEEIVRLRILVSEGDDSPETSDHIKELEIQCRQIDLFLASLENK